MFYSLYFEYSLDPPFFLCIIRIDSITVRNHVSTVTDTISPMGNADGRRMFATITKEEFSMTKTLVSALASALVVGAAGTTFAAANPFSDVPRDHWAYDAERARSLDISLPDELLNSGQ